METAVIVLAVVAAVLAIALIVTGAKLSAMRKLHSSEKAEDVYVKGGVRYSKEKPGISNLMQIMGAMLGRTVESIEAEFAGKGYGDFKKAVADAVIAGLEPVRKRYAEICADKSYVEDVLRAGTECAQRRVNRTMSKVRRKVWYLDLRKK